MRLKYSCHLVERHVLLELLHRKYVEQLVHTLVLGVVLELSHSRHPKKVVLLETGGSGRVGGE